MNSVHSTQTRTHLLFADSRNRDLTLYPSGNSYRDATRPVADAPLHLTTPIKDIERVDLVSALLFLFIILTSLLVSLFTVRLPVPL